MPQLPHLPAQGHLSSPWGLKGWTSGSLYLEPSTGLNTERHQKHWMDVMGGRMDEWMG